MSDGSLASEKVPIQHFFLTKLEKMTKKIFKQNILQNVKMDTSTSFMANGDINIYPCAWEDSKEVTLEGKRIRYRGGIEVDEDGRTRVKRWKEGTGPKYKSLFETRHGAVMINKKPDKSHPGRCYLRINFKMPAKYGSTLIGTMLAEEFDEVMAYLKTRKEDTIWFR